MGRTFVSEVSKSQSYKRKGLWKNKLPTKTGNPLSKKNKRSNKKSKRPQSAAPPTSKKWGTIEKPLGKGTVNVYKGSKWYPTERTSRKIGRKRTFSETKLRKSLVPGTILISVQGKFAGKRVVLLGSLPSGMLVVSGPFKLNGVPLRRMHPKRVIASSTKIDLGEWTLPTDISDALFRKPKNQKKEKKSAADFFDKNKKKSDKKDISEDRRLPYIKEIDDFLVPKIKAVEHLEQYIRTPFALRNGQYPHLMKF